MGNNRVGVAKYGRKYKFKGEAIYFPLLRDPPKKGCLLPFYSFV